MYNSITIDRENKNKGMRISLIIHALILLIAFFYYLPQIDKALDEEDKPPYAVKVDFTFQESSMSKIAHDDAGAQRAKSESAPQETKNTEIKEEVKPEVIQTPTPQVITVPRPDIKVPTPVITTNNDPIPTATPVEEAPIKVSTPTKVSIPTPSSSSSSTTSTSSTSGSTSGNSPNKASTVDGNDGGTGKSNAGTGAGKDKGNDGDAGAGNSSDGTGDYDGSGDGVFGRKVIFRDTKAAKVALGMSGTVTVKICVNRAGSVTFAEVLPTESTIRDRETLKNFNKAAFGYKVQPDFKAPKEQCGKITFKNDNSINNKLKKLK